MEDDEDLGFWGSIFSWFWKIIWIAIGIWIISAVFGPQKYEDQTAEEWFNDYDYCTAQVQEANTNIEEANTNIDEVNSKIEDAKYCEYGGCDYEEMQSKISDLDKAEQIEPVEEP